MPSAWNTSEIEACVRAYFDVLRAELDGQPVNKAEVYRELHAKHPGRTAKAFEFKFQNISAVLHELHRPYCDGLKPRFNYQGAIREHVMLWLAEENLQVLEPHQILGRRLLSLQRSGPHAVDGGGAGRYGLAIERLLGLDQNSSTDADFMGIELKSKAPGNTLQTLFSRVPDRYLSDHNRAGFFERHSYLDEQRGRRALYTSFGSQGDSLGFRLEVQGTRLLALRHDEPVLEYEAESLERAMLQKLSSTAFVRVRPVPGDPKGRFEIEGARLCRGPSVIRFLDLVQVGQVNLDFTMSERAGTIRDHGFLWRIASGAIEALFLENDELL